MKPKAVIISGYFNPLHKGHIDLFMNAKLKGEKLFAIVNNDHQRALKGSKEFMLEHERILILNNIKMIDKVFLSIDRDTTVRETLEKINLDFGDKFELYFANGGDQDNNSIPEQKICKKLGIELLDGLGDKIQSSSWLLKK